MKFDDELQLDGAIDRLKQYIGARPDNATAHYNLGMAYLAKENLEEAAFAFQMAMELDPGMVEAYINLGGLYLRQGKPEEAIAINEKAIEINPKAIHAHNNIGFARMLMKQPEAAAEAFRKAIELNPELIPPRLSLIRLFEQAGDYEGVIAECKEILKLDQSFALAHYNLCVAYYNQGERENAARHLDQAAQLGFPVDEKLSRLVKGEASG